MQTPEQTSLKHPFLPQSWTADKNLPRFLRDVNPAEVAVARLRKRVFFAENQGLQGLTGTQDTDGDPGSPGGPGNPGGGPGSGGSGGGGGTQLAVLTERVAALETMINGATIEAECNGDGTITVTLNWGT